MKFLCHGLGMAHPSDPRWKVAAESADQVYKQRVKKILGMLKDTERLLDKHAKAQKEKPEDWGFAGDLGRVEELLTEINAFMK